MFRAQKPSALLEREEDLAGCCWITKFWAGACTTLAVVVDVTGVYIIGVDAGVIGSEGTDAGVIGA